MEYDQLYIQQLICLWLLRNSTITSKQCQFLSTIHNYHSHHGCNLPWNITDHTALHYYVGGIKARCCSFSHQSIIGDFNILIFIPQPKYYFYMFMPQEKLSGVLDCFGVYSVEYWIVLKIYMELDWTEHPRIMAQYLNCLIFVFQLNE